MHLLVVKQGCIFALLLWQLFFFDVLCLLLRWRWSTVHSSQHDTFAFHFLYRRTNNFCTIYYLLYICTI